MYSAYGAYELKATYQRNLLIGAAFSAVLALGLAAVLLLTDRKIPPRTVRQAYVALMSTAPQPRNQRQESGRVMSDRSEAHRGFLGFAIKVIDDSRSPSPAIVAAFTSPRVLLPEPLDDPSPDPGTPDGAANGSQIDYGLPDIPYITPRLPQGLESEVREYKFEPLKIYLKPVEYPEKALNKRVEGSAIVRIIVGSTGHLDSCVLVNEAPPEWGFGKALIYALRETWYDPAIVRNEKVPSVVTVTYEFKCRDPIERTMSTSGNVRVKYENK